MVGRSRGRGARARRARRVTSPYERGGARATRARRGRRARTVIDEFGKPVEVGWVGPRAPRGPRRCSASRRPDVARARRRGCARATSSSRVNGAPVENWDGVRRAPTPRRRAATCSSRCAAASRRASAPRGATAEPESVARSTVPALGSVEALGVLPATVLVSTRDARTRRPSRAGLRPGDLIVSVDGAPVGSFGSFAEIVRASGGRALELAFARDGELPLGRRSRRTLEDYDARPRRQGAALPGRHHRARWRACPARSEIDRERNPLVAVPRAVGMTVEITRSFLAGLDEARHGRGVAQAARGSDRDRGDRGPAPIERGWESFLAILVLISINLGDPEPAADPGARRRPGRDLRDRGRAARAALAAHARDRAAARAHRAPAADGARVLERPRRAHWSRLSTGSRTRRPAQPLLLAVETRHGSAERRAAGAATRCSASAPRIRAAPPPRRCCPRSTRCSPTRGVALAAVEALRGVDRPGLVHRAARSASRR